MHLANRGDQPDRPAWRRCARRKSPGAGWDREFYVALATSPTMTRRQVPPRNGPLPKHLSGRPLRQRAVFVYGWLWQYGTEYLVRGMETSRGHT